MEDLYLRNGSTITDDEFIIAVTRLRKGRRDHLYGVVPVEQKNIVVLVDELASYFKIHRNRIRSKLRRMVKRGLAQGCPCGCRGDIVLTELGQARRLALGGRPSAMEPFQN